MDGTTRRLLARMPLAEATLWVWRWVADEQFLNDLFQRYRGRGYTRVLTFPILVHLIGSTPQASVFQFAFGLVLYNILQLLRAYLAAAQQRPLETISTEKLFRDVRRQLIAWAVLLGAAPTIQFLKQSVQCEQVRARLYELLGPLWHRRWLKAPRQKRRARPPRSARGKHVSAHQIIQANQAQAKPSQRKRV